MTVKTAEYEIAPARWPEDIEQARALLKNYGNTWHPPTRGQPACAFLVMRQSFAACRASIWGKRQTFC